jgi:hypothetical protein
MIKFINVDKDFKAKVTLWYRYSFFKFKKIQFEQQLGKEFTRKHLEDAIKKIKSDLDKMLKNN